MANHAGTNHVQIDVNKAANQMFISLNSRCMITVLPECTVTFLLIPELLGYSPGDQLKTLWYDIRLAVDHQKVDVIGGDHVVEYFQVKAFLGFKEPEMPAFPVPGEFQEKFLFVWRIGWVMCHTCPGI